MNLFELFKSEFKAILTNKNIILTIFGGILLYSFLYPQPYLNQVLKDQRIVLIDFDDSSISREIARKIDATSALNISHKVYSKKEAQEIIEREEAVGFLMIPRNFSKDLELQKSPKILYGANASYFLIYGTVMEAISDVISSLNKNILATRNLKSEQKIQKEPLVLELEAAFNPTVGYLYYIIPSVFILIFHQIILIGTGIHGATQHEKKITYSKNIGSFKLIFMRLFVFSVIYFPIALYYLGFCLDFYDIPHLAKLDELLVLIFLLIFSATSLGVFLGEILPRSELVTFIVLVSSLIFVLSSGFIWPSFLVKSYINALVNFFPVTPSIIAFLKVNQLGADFSSVVHECFLVLVLGIFYLLLAIFIRRIKLKA